ncbi:MAG: DUF2066 domain-containing protein [Candidatus Thiodiazotropha sp. 6PLUC4]
MNQFPVQLFFKLLTLSLLLALCSSAYAESVTNLYEAEVPVSGQSAEARTKGIRDAFAGVLVKVSGDSSLRDNSDLAQLLKRASGLDQQKRYKSLDSGSEAVAANAPDRLLWARFDERAVNRLLRESGIPVWGETRPSMLVWLGEEKGTRRVLISPEREAGLKRQLTGVADFRGMPLVWPLMDIEDQNALQVSDLWGGFEENIRRASDRYLPDVILVGRLSHRGRSSWRGEWMLYLPDKIIRWQAHANSKQALAREGIEQAVDALALRFAPQQVSQGVANLRLRVHGLPHLADYVLVQDYLRSLAMIENVDLLSAGEEKVSFLLRVHGGRDALVRGIQLGSVLEPVVLQESPDPDQPDNISDEMVDGEGLDYRLR